MVEHSPKILASKKKDTTKFSLMGIISSSSSPFLLVCEQFLKGIIHPLAVKSTQTLDLAHQKERVAFWYG